ncbi:uncharacterized protein LOC109134136 [Beta vulgaris subsp. vulgaris]|uniref:uncharacterized protein LOC109134136 n=1 Tax=Beta vulgaris subsp. vulgaris TaxID=3555 RepID=UPI002548C55F|nr:uncharacterized protein LOC109134136 [Beta vulgaris subsp. vulgaris]
MDTIVCIRMWHGGQFKKNKYGNLDFVGGDARTFQVDADELCWFYLEELANKCGKYSSISEIYYLTPHCKSFEQGLKRVYNDSEVRIMTELVLKNRFIDCYVVHGVDTAEVVLEIEGGETQSQTKVSNVSEGGSTRPKKLTPIRGGKKGHKSPVVPETQKATPLPEPVSNSGGTLHFTQAESTATQQNEPHLTHVDSPTLDNTFTETILNASNQSETEQRQQPEAEGSHQPLSELIQQPETQQSQINQYTENLEEGYETDYDEHPDDSEFIPDDVDTSDVETEVEEEDFEGLSDEGEEDIAGEGEEYVEGLEVGSDGGTDDEEWRVAKDSLRSWNSRIVGIARDLQKEAASGKLTGQQKQQRVSQVELKKPTMNSLVNMKTLMKRQIRQVQVMRTT